MIVVRPAPPLTDTAAPGATRRRVWAGPAVKSHAALVLAAARFYLVPAGATLPAAAVAALDAGADPADTLPAGTVGYDLAAVRRATLHLPADAVAVELDGVAAPVVVTLADPATADDVFARLVRRAGGGYTLTADTPGTLARARVPLGVTAGVAVATLTLALTVSGLPDVAAAHPAPAGWLTALAALDWRAVGAAGGVPSAAAQVWLYRTLTRPPAWLTLARTAQPPATQDTP